MNKKPQCLTFNEASYPLVFLTHYTGRRDSAYMLVDGKPIISIEFYYNQPFVDGLDRAEAALQSYRQNKGLWSLLPESAHSFFDPFDKQQQIAPDGYYQKQLESHVFDLSSIAIPSTTVEIYDICKTPHMVVTTRQNDKEASFAIWDRDLMRMIATQHNQRLKGSARHKCLTQESPAMHAILQNIFA